MSNGGRHLLYPVKSIKYFSGTLRYPSLQQVGDASGAEAHESEARNG